MKTLLGRAGRAVLGLAPMVGLALALWATAPVAAARLAIPPTPQTWCVQKSGTYAQTAPCANPAQITDLQTAIDGAALGDTIELSQDFYQSGAPGYSIPSNWTSLTIVGGYPGTTSPPTSTGWTQYGPAGLTVIVGDLQQTNQCFSTPIQSKMTVTIYNLVLQCGGIASSGTIDVPASQLIIASPVGNVGGNFTVAPSASLDFWPSINGGLVLSNGTTITGGPVKVEEGNGSGLAIGQSSTEKVTVDNLELDDTAAIQGPGQLTVNKSFTWNGGTLGPTGTFVVAQGATALLTSESGQEFLANATLTLNGPTTDENFAASNLAMNGQATLNNNGAFTFSGDSDVGAGADLSESVVNGTGGSIVKTCCARG
ncbi:MAG: hypothetical protein ACRDIY_08270, partial [Chloroflexota bacterium]